jgi:hypothetical protein
MRIERERKAIIDYDCTGLTLKQEEKVLDKIIAEKQKVVMGYIKEIFIEDRKKQKIIDERNKNKEL